MKTFDSSLYLVTNREGMEEAEFLKKIELALKSGVTLLQLREKQGTTAEMISLAAKVHAISQKYGVPLIIDDRVDVMMAANAEGVHLGKEDMPLEIARRLIGPEKILGATTKTVEQAKEAYEKGANYLGVGAIYPTTTKVKTVLTSVETLREICHSVSIPVNAIGGLTSENLRVLDEIPISGICVVSSIMYAKDTAAATKALKESFYMGRKK